MGSGPRGLQRDPFALDQGPQLAQWAPAGDQALIGALNTSKELSSLQEASFVYQENSLRRFHIGGQKVLPGTPLSLTGAIMGMARISRDGCITLGGPVVWWPQRAHDFQRGPFALDEGSHRLISLRGAPARDRILIGALNTCANT